MYKSELKFCVICKTLFLTYCLLTNQTVIYFIYECKEMVVLQKEFTKRKKLGYCSGIVTESLLYNMFYTYYLVFLTDVIKMNPILAGTVSFISIFWDAVTDPIIGSFADVNGADKRKFMAKATFPLGITFIAAFVNIGTQSSVIQFIYYTAAAMLFWLAYTVYTIPYYAVVAEITQDYDERTSIRSTSSLINTAAIFLGNALPAVLPSLFAGLMFSGKKMGDSFGWSATAVIMSAMSIIFAVITVKSLRGIVLQKAETAADNGRKSIKTIFSEFFEVLKIKPFKWFAMFIVFFLMASSMIQSSFEYMIKYLVNKDPETWMTVVIIELVVVMAAFIPLVTKIAETKDRRFSSILFMSLMCAGLIVCRIIGVRSIAVVLAVTFCMAMGMANFWTVFYSMAYDLVEVDEFAYGTRRESVITALPQFFQKFGAAVGVWTVSLILQLTGYNADLAAQNAKTINGIENNVTLIPAAFLILSVIGAVMYPITKEKFNLLGRELEKKRGGEKYSAEGLEKII